MHGTDGFADKAVVARRSRVRLEATLLNGAAARTELLGKRHAHFVPCVVAARRLGSTHQFTAIGA